MGADRRVALVIPTLDEAEAIGATIARVPRDLVDRVVVADGGSRDETLRVARDAGAEAIQVGRGYGLACLEGARFAADCDIVVFADGDGADPVERIGELVRPLADDRADFVLASRVRGQRMPGSMGWHQVVAGRAAGLAIGALYGTTFTDMSAFRAIRREALLGLGLRERHYGWNLEMQMRAAAAGWRIREIPLPYGCRAGGASKVAGSLSGTWRAGRQILGTFLRVAARPVEAP